MKISSRFSIAVHIVLILVFLGHQQKQTSDFLSSCIPVNPVVIRRILGMLKKAGIVDIKSGEGGAILLVDPSELSLLDIYQAVESCDSLFNSHKEPPQKCPMNCYPCPKIQNSLDSESANSCLINKGCFIYDNIENHLQSAQKAMEESLKSTTIQQIILELNHSEPKS